MSIGMVAASPGRGAHVTRRVRVLKKEVVGEAGGFGADGGMYEYRNSYVHKYG